MASFAAAAPTAAAAPAMSVGISAGSRFGSDSAEEVIGPDREGVEGAGRRAAGEGDKLRNLVLERWDWKRENWIVSPGIAGDSPAPREVVAPTGTGRHRAQAEFGGEIVQPVARC